MSPVRAWSLALVAVIGCEHAGPTDGVERARLGSDAARVGAIAISVPLVQSVVSSSGASARDALQSLIDDAVAASGALERHLDETAPTRALLRAQRARFVTTKAKAAVEAAGAPTDADIDALAAEQWFAVDAPEAIHVVHAVVLRKPTDAGVDETGAGLAVALRAAVADAPSDDDFQRRAQGFPKSDHEVRGEDLPPFVADGRVLAADSGSMDAQFARAAFDLTTPGATSPVIETPFGWHVIRLVERLPAKRLTRQERRQRFEKEIYERRTRDAIVKLSDERKRVAPVETMSAADALLAEVHIDLP